MPRIGYVHSWQRTQDEGWVRGALDTYGVPYTYFADQKLRDGNLRAKYDVIIFPHVGGNATSQVNGIAKIRHNPRCPTGRRESTPNLGALDQSDDIRGGMGIEGLTELAKFVQAGGTLIVEGSTSTIFPAFGLTTGITIEEPATLFARGSIFRGIITDKKSPIAYGYDGTQLPVYFNQAPVHQRGRERRSFRVRGVLWAAQTGPSQNITPMAQRLRFRRGRPTRRRRREPRGAGRSWRGRSVAGGAVPSDGAAVRHQRRRRTSARRDAVPGATRTTCCSPARCRTVSSWPTARRWWTRRWAGARRDVRHSAVLAVADAGDVLPRLQCDSELERPRRREGGTAASNDLESGRAALGKIQTA